MISTRLKEVLNLLAKNIHKTVCFFVSPQRHKEHKKEKNRITGSQSGRIFFYHVHPAILFKNFNLFSLRS